MKNKRNKNYRRKRENFRQSRVGSRDVFDGQDQRQI